MYQISPVSKNLLSIFLLETVITPNLLKQANKHNKLMLFWCELVIFYGDMIQKHGVFCGVRLPPLMVVRLCDPQGCDLNAFGQLIDDDSEVQ